MSCDCDTREPIEHDGITLQRCPHCPECGDLGSYEGAGSTSVNNWTGRPYSRYYCSECDIHYKVYAPRRDTPTVS